MRLTAEEFFELVVATYAESKIEPWRLERLGESLRWVVENCPVKIDLPAFVDAHVDLGWILEGTCVSFGVNSTPVWAEVQRANMSKEGRECGHTKPTKPTGWIAPDIEGSLKAQGWRA